MLKLTLTFILVSNVLAQVPVAFSQPLPVPNNNLEMQNELFHMAPQPIPVVHPLPIQEGVNTFESVQVGQHTIPVVNPVQIQEVDTLPVQMPQRPPFLAHPYGDGNEPFYRDDIPSGSLPEGAVLKAFRDSDSDDDSDRGRIVNDRRRRRTTTRRPTTRRPIATTRPVEIGSAELPCGFTCSRKTVFLYLDPVWTSATCSDTNADVRVRCDNCCKARGLNAGLDGDWSAGFVSNNGRECICCHQNAQCGGRPVAFNE